MDGQDYLNQISAAVRPEKRSKKDKILSSKFFLIGAIGVIGFILILILGAILSSGKGGEKNLSFRLKLHLDNTESVIQEYQPSVKSSVLRSSSASLYSVLTNTNRELTDYITAKFNFKDKEVDKKLKDELQLEKDGIVSDLFEAKINGVLDRMYAHKMAYEVSMIMTEEDKIYDMTGDETLKNLLSTSYNSLKNLYDKFNDFSEAK